jgi:hypothetical protein
MFAAALACVPQQPQDFLIRGNMYKAPGGFKRGVERAIEYRVKNYGHVPGYGREKLNPVSAPSQSEETRFLGLPVRLHRKILKAVQCAEQTIREECGGEGAFYWPRRLSGLRGSNTYRGGEISNHMFGIAMDVDPDRNPCCGCVPPWSDAPKCRKPSKDPFDRAELTPCWVDAFERYGFYWLGRDKMQDTMHFEFLGDPSKL